MYGVMLLLVQFYMVAQGSIASSMRISTSDYIYTECCIIHATITFLEKLMKIYFSCSITVAERGRHLPGFGGKMLKLGYEVPTAHLSGST